jgi:hypothetical protein
MNLIFVNEPTFSTEIFTGRGVGLGVAVGVSVGDSVAVAVGAIVGVWVGAVVGATVTGNSVSVTASWWSAEIAGALLEHAAHRTNEPMLIARQNHDLFISPPIIFWILPSQLRRLCLPSDTVLHIILYPSQNSGK